jgi:hypothetical protein
MEAIFLQLTYRKPWMPSYDAHTDEERISVWRAWHDHVFEIGHFVSDAELPFLPDDNLKIMATLAFLMAK